MQTLIEKALKQYRMVEPGDKILAAISGGKDSLTMLTFLNRLRANGTVNFKLYAAHIRTDFRCAGCMHDEALAKIFNDSGIDYYFKEVKILDEGGRTNCFWCSRCRRKALFELAAELDCRKIAFGHHKDDIIETCLLNLFFNGEVSAMKPRQELFGGEITLIRPLCFVEESAIVEFAKISNFPKQLCRCPFGRDSRRNAMKSLIRELDSELPQLSIRENIFNSFLNAKERELETKERG